MSVQRGEFEIFTYVKPSKTATMFSHKIAAYISQSLGRPPIWTKDVARRDLDTLIIVAGGVPFCGCLDALGKAVLRAERVIFVQNDYHSKLPSPDGKGMSPYRAAFRLRRKRGMRPPDRWSTIEDYAKEPGSAYVNWNLLAYAPPFFGWRGSRTAPTLAYYGSMRKERVPVFERYFRDTGDLRVVVSNNSGWADDYDVQSVAVKGPDLNEFLISNGVGLYLEDPLAASVHMSPACRFYEMLAAGMPMVFQTESADTLSRYGLSVGDYVVKNAAAAKRFVRGRVDVAREQAGLWRRDYGKTLDAQFKKAVMS